MVESGQAAHLQDFPLHADAASELRPPPPAPEPEASAGARGPAPLEARFFAAAADAATLLLLAAAAILGARLLTGSSPRPAGFAWAFLFLVFLSFFATVPPLVLFGRTLGMAIGDLAAHDGSGAGLTAGAAVRRWAGTLATAATAGLLLLWARQSADLPTPADRFSGRTLSLD
ncbi:MAG TPA: RDD family protein [Thermoanaerobaculia bacterium]|nr:RDD family protein [Thermoanaerobaculia bacterium]